MRPWLGALVVGLSLASQADAGAGVWTSGGPYGGDVYVLATHPGAPGRSTPAPTIGASSSPPPEPGRAGLVSERRRGSALRAHGSRRHLADRPSRSQERHERGVDDFDADGKSDLVFWNQNSGEVQFWLMNGTIRTGAAVPIGGAPSLPTNWNLSATADFNHDGRPDLLWRNFTSQKLVVWTMNGTSKLGTLIPNPAQAVNFNWTVVAAADYNGDGETDLLWYNVDSGKVVTWYLDAGLQRLSGQFVDPPNAGNSNWQVLASGDFSAAYAPVTPPLGSPDVVWRNADSGSQVVWHLDFASTRVFGQFTLPVANTPPLDWTIVGPR